MTESFSAFDPAPPGIPRRKWERLCAFLGELPPAASLRLFAALEASGRESGDLPAQAILAIFRRRLIVAGERLPARKMTAERLFFAPFEDFFIARRRGRKKRARIARSTLDPVWSLVLHDAACREASRAAHELEAAIARGESDLRPFEDALFEAAADGLARLVDHAEEDAAFRADLGARLGGADAQAGAAALHDLAELGQLLPAVAHLRAVRAAFARPAPALTEEDMYEARRIYARASRESPEAASYALLAIAARMDAPWRAMPLYYHLSNAADDELPLIRHDAALLAATLFDDLESAARGLEQDADDDPDTEEAPARLAHVADFAAGMIAAARRANDAPAASRAEASRDIAAAALARYAECALGAMRRNHPVRHAGGSSRLRALRPDIDRPVDALAERAARAGAAFLAAAPRLAARLERPAVAASVVADALAETRRYAGDLVREIRAAEGEERAAARRRMEATLSAAEPLLPPDEIALLRERASVAAVSA